jgi:hypothetical protein
MNPMSRELANDLMTEATLESVTNQKASFQFVTLVAMWGKALENGMDTADSLAEDILYQQATKIRRYQRNAFPLSERQVKVIWNHTARWAYRNTR